MKKERPYQFRELLEQVHKPNRRNPDADALRENETLLDDTWVIRIPEHAEDGVKRAAMDFQDYLFVSMNLSVQITESGKDNHAVILQCGTEKGSRAYTYQCTRDTVVICGDSWIGVQQGLYYLEDLMNLRELPALEQQEKPIRRAPYFSPRMVHSGYGLDQFPDSHLSAIAHAGFDSILIFATAPDMTRQGPLDFNDIIHRAKNYGLDTYFYSYLDGFKHPDDADADAFFDAGYGALFKHSPEAKGIVLVSESCEFPTKDPRANSYKTTEATNEYTQGICGHKAGSGWWPCSDYPQWIDAVKRACKRYNPEADVIFWTYGFGRAPVDAQQSMIRNYPKDASLLVTFEMYEQRRFEHHTAMQCDYSITYPGPSRMFRVEAEAAHEKNIRLYSMTNTAGRTWDNGVCPYEPVPQQWFKRFENMHKARKDWNLSGLMECHHYGWYPSVVSECAKWSFWSPDADLKEILARIAKRDFGPAGGPLAVQAWAKWSEAIGKWAPNFGDQAGPMRVGAAYPFIFLPYLYPHVEQSMKYPSTTQSICGSILMHPCYYPEHVYGGSACGRTLHEDLRILPAAMKIWDEGIALMEQAVAAAPESKRDNAEKMLGVGVIFRCAMTTVINSKKWFLLNRKIEIENDFDEANRLMDQMYALIEEELANVNRAIPYAENDSVIGWEPRSDYQGDAWHLHWKVRQLENLRDFTLRAYRQTLSETPPFDVELEK